MRSKVFRLFLLIVLVTVVTVSSSTLGAAEKLYFPGESNWDTISPQELGWNMNAIKEMEGFLKEHSSKSFLILKDGKIVVEKYWAKENADYKQRVYSVGKSLTAFLVGLAQEKGKLEISQSVSDFIPGWTKENLENEKKIKIQHLLSMNSGLDNRLKFEAEPGEKWRYNTKAYHNLHDLLEAATGYKVDQVAKKVLYKPLGMKNTKFLKHTFEMNARDMARFGLMVLAGGNWNGREIMEDKDFFYDMVNTSQQDNPSYGYLWWLNGKDSFIAGHPPKKGEGSLVPAAPADMFCALGKNDQKIFIVPSQNLVVIRQGDSAENDKEDAVTTFTNEIWQHLNKVIGTGNVSNNADPGISQPAYKDNSGFRYFDQELTIPAWANPDIKIFLAQNGKEVTDQSLHQGVDYIIKTRVYNFGNETAENVKVQTYFSRFALLGNFKEFGNPVVVEKINPGEFVDVEIPAKSKIKGHASLQIRVSSPGDKDKTNNCGRRSLWVIRAAPGKTFKRRLNIANLVFDGDEVKYVDSVKLKTKVTLYPASFNTAQNQSLVRVRLNPETINFDQNNKVQVKKSLIKINLDKKLPVGGNVRVKILPESGGQFLNRDGCTFHFHVFRRKNFTTDGGM
ncbi:MAG: serine hydrolase [Candidatus Rifleibacteriota bacterium]